VSLIVSGFGCPSVGGRYAWDASAASSEIGLGSGRRLSSLIKYQLLGRIPLAVLADELPDVCRQWLVSRARLHTRCPL
jgi:hypothetical protein